MKKTISFSGLLIPLVFLFSSCTKSNGNTNSGTSNATPGPLFTTLKTMMSVNCAVSGCHAGSNPQSGLDFTNSNTIVAQKDRIKVRAVDQSGTVNQMPQPPNPPLSAADQKKITDWLNAGGRITD